MLEEFTKQLNKTLDQYKTLYNQSMKQAEDHMNKLSGEQKKDFINLINEIKEATKEQDSNKLRSLIYKVKNKR